MRGYSYVYILQSSADPQRHYTGLTGDLSERLRKHNAGEVPHTAKFKPWVIRHLLRHAASGSHATDCALRFRVVAGAIVVLKAIQSHPDPGLCLIENRMASDVVCQVPHRDAG
jgi:predicted GIY-YIG superfamily endonuclease